MNLETAQGMHDAMLWKHYQDGLSRQSETERAVMLCKNCGKESNHVYDELNDVYWCELCENSVKISDGLNDCLKCGGPVDINEIETDMWWVHGGMIVYAKCRDCGQVYRANLTLDDFKEEVNEESEQIAT